MEVFVDMDCEYHLCYAGLLAWFLSYKDNDRENNNLYEATPVAGQASVPLLSHLTFSLVFLTCHFVPE